MGSDHITLISPSEKVVYLVQLSNGFEQHSYEMGEVVEGRGGVTSLNILPSSHACSLGEVLPSLDPPHRLLILYVTSLSP